MTTTTQDLIYSELCLMREDFKTYINKMDKRVSSLEQWRDKLVGVFITVGIGLKYTWDYLKERMI